MCTCHSLLLSALSVVKKGKRGRAREKKEEEEAAAAAHRSFSSLEYVLIKYRLIVWGLLCVKKERIKLKFEQTHFVEPFLQKVWTKSKAALFVNWKQTPCVILIQLTPKKQGTTPKRIYRIITNTQCQWNRERNKNIRRRRSCPLKL